MAATDSRQNTLTRWLTSNGFAHLWRLVITILLTAYFAMLTWQTIHRAVFPWDMHIWAESPFLTDLLKLDHASPVYTSPSDVNSFVYSPGLEYVTFAILKPFGAELDIRYCRLVNILIGVVAAACGAFVIQRLACSCPQLAQGRWGFWVAWAALILVLFKNFTSDIPHPDNLHTLQALLVFYLCFAAVETKSFALALASMIVAGLGVLTKQTDGACAAGPAIAFLVLKTWDRRRWLILIAVAALICGLSLKCLWWPQYARFYTYELLSHQARYPYKLVLLGWDLLKRERGVLALLSLFAAFYLWKLQGAARRYVVCIVAVGAAATTLTTAAYIKEFGSWNNIGALQMFLAILVWPLVWNFPILLRTRIAANPEKRSFPDLVFGGLGVALVILLVPIKNVPQPGYYEYCQKIESAVRDDLKAGRKVMVSHGAEFLIRAGDLAIPLDRANSSGELYAGNFGDLAGTDARLRSHYYDRIYLMVGFGFWPAEFDAFHRYYHVIGTIPAYRMPNHRGYASGFQPLLWGDCEILAPNEK